MEAFYGSSFATYPSSVNVVAGQTTANINFQLTVTVTPSGTVSGTVTSSGAPVDSAYITVQGPGGSNSNYTDSNGNYVISTGLGTGSYIVNVTATGYVSQQQTGVLVTVNQITTVNFALTVKASGVISGTVSSLQANPFPTPTPTPTPAPTPTPTPTASPLRPRRLLRRLPHHPPQLPLRHQRQLLLRQPLLFQQPLRLRLLLYLLHRHRLLQRQLQHLRHRQLPCQRQLQVVQQLISESAGT